MTTTTELRQRAEPLLMRGGPMSPEMRTMMLGTRSHGILGQQAYSKILKIAVPNRDVQAISVDDLYDSTLELQILELWISCLISANEDWIDNLLEQECK